MRDVMNACTSVLTDSVSNDRRTRLSWRSQKKHVAQIITPPPCCVVHNPAGNFLKTVTNPLIPDHIRPTRRGPDPNRPTKKGVYDLGGVCPGEVWSVIVRWTLGCFQQTAFWSVASYREATGSSRSARENVILSS